MLAEDKLFATLDPTMRRFEMPDVGPVVLADTVGFISHLPHKLVEAFSATLEEATNASLLLHVVDAAGENRQDNFNAVVDVLDEIGAAENPVLIVYNKIDLLSHGEARVDRDDTGRPVAVWLSAASGEGIDLLIDAVRELLSGDMFSETIYLQPELGRLRARFYELNAVKQEQACDDGGSLLTVRMPSSDFNRLLKSEGVGRDRLAKAIPACRESA